MRLGIDTGGTFTDIVGWDGGRFLTRKVRSTPENPARAILEGIEGLAAAEIIHGSTVATNALLERKGARTAFLTTKGFEDLLRIGRQNRKHLYDFFGAGRAQLVKRSLGVEERTLYDGTIEKQVDPAAARKLAERLKRGRIESVAVCLLHSYANPANELRLKAELEGFFVSLSHQILPEYREFERAATTLVNAYVSPLMSRYLANLSQTLGQTPLRIMQSNGGSIAASVAGSNAVHTIQSGPAGGVLGAVAVARRAGFDRVITFDMGGTSTDVSLYDGRYRFTQESELGDFPVRVPMLDIHSVGAGGGSIAYVDAGGALRVGPQSAGAQPGPVCYGEGERITITDANLYLGRINPEKFLSGRMKLDVDRAARYLERFARSRGVSPEQMAEAILEVANSNMERAIRVVSIERGYDPREFALVSFGGAGGLHACRLAERLGISAVLVPRFAGVLSALGMLVADCVREYSRSVLGAEAEPAFAEMERQAAEEFAAMGFPAPIGERKIDLRYRGQSYEITVPYAERGALWARFHEEHRRLYGYHHEGTEVEAVTARIRAVCLSEEVNLAAPAPAETFSSTYVPPGAPGGHARLGRGSDPQHHDRAGRHRDSQRSVSRRYPFAGHHRRLRGFPGRRRGSRLLCGFACAPLRRGRHVARFHAPGPGDLPGGPAHSTGEAPQARDDGRGNPGAAAGQCANPGGAPGRPRGADRRPSGGRAEAAGGHGKIRAGGSSAADRRIAGIYGAHHAGAAGRDSAGNLPL
ncbi:MAG: hydantoinase/oxoprolinase family protein [Acidobacteria bacterium]|nr:hydantoinase/oxoprolinase family protein [Acidobacteriota bacterium]